LVLHKPARLFVSEPSRKPGADSNWLAGIFDQNTVIAFALRPHRMVFSHWLWNLPT